MPHFGLCKHMEHSARKLLALESQCHPFSDPASEEHNHSKHNTEKMALVAMTMHKKTIVLTLWSLDGDKHTWRWYIMSNSS